MLVSGRLMAGDFRSDMRFFHTIIAARVETARKNPPVNRTTPPLGRSTLIHIHTGRTVARLLRFVLSTKFSWHLYKKESATPMRMCQTLLLLMSFDYDHISQFTL